MATARILLGFLCFASISSLGQSDGDLLKEATARTQLLNTARREIGVRELTGNNDGKKVAEYLASVKLSIGEPWCAAFISWVFKQHGFLEPNTGWSPAMFPNTRILSNAVENATKANVFGIYIIAKKRIAHVGLVEDQHRGWVTTIEGNTNSAGSNEGDGVYRKLRHIRTIRSFADWVKKGRLK